MTNISHITWSFLDKSPIIRKNLELGIINLRALASLIKKEESLDTSLDSIISAIRRYKIHEVELNYAEVKSILKECKISTKTKIVILTIKREPNYVTDVLSKVVKFIDPAKGDVLRFVEGRESAKLILDARNLEKIKQILGSDILKTDQDLCEINIVFPINKPRTSGLRAMTLTELATHGVKVVEMLSCLPEFMIFVKEKNIAKAYQLLLDMYYSKE